MIRIDAVWLAVEPMDMRAGAERLLSSVVRVFGSARGLITVICLQTPAQRASSSWCTTALGFGAPHGG